MGSPCRGFRCCTSRVTWDYVEFIGRNAGVGFFDLGVGASLEGAEDLDDGDGYVVVFGVPDVSVHGIKREDPEYSGSFLLD